nr:reverse transcriptase domain-containing protein [Tanacetum cinerariifolium]
MEDEFYNLVVKGNDLKTYVRRFQELAVLCPNMVPNSEKLMEAFIGGLSQSIEGNVTASKPQTLEEAINIAHRLMDQIIKHDSMQETDDHKRKLEDKRNTIDHNNYPKYCNNNNHSNNYNNDNYQNDHNNYNRNNDHHQQPNKRRETFRTYTATNRYAGNLSLCKRCRLHYTGPCSVKCQEVMCVGYEIICGGLGIRVDVLDGVGWCHGCFGLKWSHVLSFLAKEVLEKDCPTFFNDNEDHSVQYKEYLENSSKEIAASNSNQDKEKPPQDSDIRFYCMHDNVDDLIESALNSKLLSINLESQRLDKKKHEVKNVIEQPTERETLHAITPVLPTEEPEYSLSMGYEHLSTTPETESDEVTESSAKNLLPIPSEYEVTSDDDSECDVPVKDESSSVFTTFSNPLFDGNDNFTSSDDESLFDEDVPTKNFKVYSNPLFDDEEINSDEIDPHCFNDESDFVESLSNRDTLIVSSLKFDFLVEFSGALLPTSIADEECIRREHAEYISLMERLFTINPCPRSMENFNTAVETLSTSHIPLEDSDSQREEIDIFTGTDDLLPPSIESEDYDSEWEIHVLEELLVDDSISLPKNESFYFDHQDDPSFHQPSLELPDVEFDFEPNSGEVIAAVMNNIDELNEDECFDPGDEIDVFTNVEDDDYFPFMLVIQIFPPYLIYPEDLSPQ